MHACTHTHTHHTCTHTHTHAHTHTHDACMHTHTLLAHVYMSMPIISRDTMPYLSSRSVEQLKDHLVKGLVWVFFEL